MFRRVFDKSYSFGGGIMLPSELKRDYKAVSYTLCSCVGGLIFMRIAVYLLPFSGNTYGEALGENAVFALCTQLVFFLAVPFCIYKFYGKRTVVQTLEYGSCKRFKPYYLLAVPLGITVFMLTVGISAIWTALLRLTGYTILPSTPPMPDEFVFGFFVADIVLTAILPAVCEEFCMRGGLLTTAQKSFKTLWCIILCAIIFGLFHQNIRQVFYTALFGGLAAFVTIKTKSLYPAMLMHFSNNFCSVFIDYATNYDWASFGRLYALLGSAPAWAIALIFLTVAACGAVIVVLMLYIREKKIIKGKYDALKDCAFDATNKRVVFFGEFDSDKVKALEMEKEVYGAAYTQELYKPALRDIAIVIALGVVTVLTTVFTYVWGFFY